jgi:hypothetical protein
MVREITESGRASLEKARTWVEFHTVSTTLWLHEDGYELVTASLKAADTLGSACPPRPRSPRSAAWTRHNGFGGCGGALQFFGKPIQRS